MKTNMAETSLAAYHSLPPKDYLQPKELEVMRLFRNECLKLTREQIAARLGWKVAAVCGRVNSLVTKGKLEEIKGGTTNSGHSAKLVKLPAGQMGLAL